MIDHIERAFTQARAQGRAALIPYIMCGHPTPAETVMLARALADAGADMIELGIPFSDPLADGPTIQHAGQLALGNGVGVGTCIALAGEIAREVSTPLVFMGYWNPILQYGPTRFCQEAVDAGVSALIVPDLPPQEAGELVEAARASGLATVFLVAPTSTPERIRAATQLATGFVYCVALTGVTGARTEGAPTTASELVARVRLHTDLPCVIGFGISEPAHVAALAGAADGVVVGSALVDLIERTPGGERQDAVQSFVASLREATPSGRKEQEPIT